MASACAARRPSVSPGREAYEVTASAHRLRAARKIGLDTVPCVVVDDDDLHAELAMIDENLCRAELSPADRASQTARRKAIYLELHPETAQHVSGGMARQGAASDNLSFAAATADAIGKTERTAQRDAERGEGPCAYSSALEFDGAAELSALDGPSCCSSRLETKANSGDRSRLPAF